MRHGELDAETAQGLKTLRERIEQAAIPPSMLDKMINVATWNIRDFGKKPRMAASIHYIAEILSQFDLIAVTEVRDDLSDMKRTLDILGPYWRMVVSDYAADYGGNKERIAYVYDKRAVVFTGLAAEADPLRKKVGSEWVADKTWWRAPYMASFTAGNFDFVLLTTHIRWGKSIKARADALSRLAEWVHKRRRSKGVVDKDIIVMGDFNIPKIGDRLYQAVTSKGLQVPRALLDVRKGPLTTNLARNKRYDQILHYPTRKKRFTDKAGVLDFYCGDIQPLYPTNPELLRNKKFTWELSDHLPLWAQVDVWIEDERLDGILRRRTRRASRRRRG